jgi:hypothetical protein
MGIGKKGKVFTRKPYDKFLYKWSAQTEVSKKSKTKDQPFFCTAKPNTNGEDFVTTYVYDKVNENGTVKRYAYVECDYVE